MAGEAFVYGGDDRYVNNLFLAVDDSAKPLCTADAAGAAGMAEAGTAFFDGYPRSLEESEQLIEEAGLGDEELYRSVKQPVLLASNAYVSGAKAASGEAEAVVSGDGSSLALRETDDELWMTVSLPESIRSATGPVILANRVLSRSISRILTVRRLLWTGISPVLRAAHARLEAHWRRMAMGKCSSGRSDGIAVSTVASASAFVWH